MTLTLAARMTFDASKARAELRGVGVDTKAFATQTRDAGNTAKRAAADLAAYEARVAALEAELRSLVTAQKAQEDAVRRSVPANNAAAGAAGNMAAQFNDIAVTVAAGQNPLQIAIQQGTQIGQAFGGRGAAGAIGLLKQGFLQMISPVNLVTIAVIAGGAALLQWGLDALGAGESAEKLRTDVDSLSTSIDSYKSAVDAANATTSDLRLAFGDASAAVGGTLDLLREIAAADAQDAIDRVASSLANLLGTGGGGDARAELASFFDVNIMLAFTDAQRAAREEARQLTLQFQEQQAALANADGNIDAQIAAMADLLSTTRELANATDGVNEEERELIQSMRDALLAMVEQKRTMGEVKTETERAKEAAIDLYNVATSSGWFAAAISGVNGLIGRIGAAISATQRLRSAQAFTAQQVFDQNNDVYSGRGGDPRQVNNRFTPSQATIDATEALLNPPTTGGAGGGGGGRAAAVREEVDAVQKLIAQQQRELDILRETDPIKKELLRQREALADATDAERNQIEALITARQREAAEIKANADLTDFLNQSAATFLDSLIVKGAKASDVIRNLVSSILQAGIQAFALGQGPLAGLLGISGGLFGGGAGGGRLPLFANGGEVRGPGTGTSDSILARLSDGEHIINAQAASRHRGLLEMINAGVPLPAFARGGQVGPSRGAQRTSGLGGGAGGDGAMELTVNVAGAKGNAEIEQMVILGVRRGIELYNREVLPSRVLQISRNPRVRGA